MKGWRAAAAVLLAVACLWQWTRGAERTAHIPPQTPRCDLAPALEGGAPAGGSERARQLFLQTGLPALRAAVGRGAGLEEAGVAALLALMAEAEDTNLAVRGGLEGQRWAREQAGKLLRETPVPSRQAVEALGVEPAECLVIEDSPLGIEAGERSGARVLALRPHEGVNLDQSRADAVIDNLNDILAAL